MSYRMNVILNKEIVANTWRMVSENEALAELLQAAGNLVVPLSLWQQERAALAGRSGKTGVWLKGPDDPAQLQLNGTAPDLPLIAIEFAQFVDGRGYSIGRLLRERYGFKGELRAFGDVFRDQLPYLTRCGFNSFVLKEGKSLEDALKAFDDFSDAYQNAADQPVPHYRRRLAAAAA